VDTVDGRQPPTRSHVNTGEWQSFEVRMRRRRVERLIVRAETALADGNTDQVREALEEARRLAPGVPQIAALEQALESVPVDLALAPIDAPVVDSLAIDPSLEILAAHPTNRRRHRRTLAAAAVLTIAIGGAAAWVYMNGAIPWQTSTDSPSSSPAEDVVAASQAEPSTSRPSTRVRVETVNASPVDLRSEPRPFEPIAEIPHVQLAQATPDPQPAATSGITALATPSPVPRDLDPVPATFAERTAPLPSLDVPASSTIAEARTTIPLSAPEPKLAPRSEPMARTERAGASVADSTTLTAAEDAAVRGVLNRYATAYSHLDASAAQEVWPAVNRSALSRAFEGLASQQVSLERCAVDVRGATAHATCAGSATWSPKIGNGGPKTEARNWTFQLAKAGSDWQIVSARVQNR
jgi:hypothetical protein